MANPHPANPFQKNDPRINRKGRPRNFDALRTLAQEIAHEVARDRAGNALTHAGHSETHAEMILRRWATSGDFRQQQAFLEVAFGKVPNPIIKGPTGEDAVCVIQYVRPYTDGELEAIITAGGDGRIVKRLAGVDLREL